MRHFTTTMAVLVGLAAAPAGMAQTAAQPQQGGTVGTPTRPGAGGSTLTQGTAGQTGTAPGTTAPGTTVPGTTVPSTTSPGMNPPPATGSVMPSTSGAAAPGTNSPPTTATPVTGSNSFTEGQARSRIEAAGYTDVGPLQLDGAGVWRGRGTRSGAAAPVGLDFQGNVVTGAGR